MEAKRERLLTVPVVFGICLASLAGTATVFYQTKIANPTVEEYFSFISIARLLTITHVHIFGYSTMGFILWTLGRRQGAATNPLFGTLLGLTVCAGILDILSWWGVIYVSPVFRFLTFAMGGAFVGGIMLSGLMVLLACRRNTPIAEGTNKER
jgi:hypothetical protein